MPTRPKNTVPNESTPSDTSPPRGGEIGDQIVIKRLSEIDAEPTEWLVPGRIPKGKLVIIAGDGGLGKSTLIRHLAAKLSRGLPAFGMSYPVTAPGDTILVAAEDGYKDVVVPSLAAERANLNRVWYVESVVKTINGRKATIQFGVDDLDALKTELARRPDTKLIVIDPVASLVGRAGINDHLQSELRRVLDPLGALAEETGITVVLIAHVNKCRGEKAVNKIAGSTAYKNASRMGFLLDIDPRDEDARLAMPIKFNLFGVDRSAMVFRQVKLTSREIGDLRKQTLFRKSVVSGTFSQFVENLFRLQFDEPRFVNADEVVGAERTTERKKGKVEECAAWLRNLHAQYAYPAKEIEALADSRGFNSDNLKKARPLVTGLQKELSGYQGQWWWGIGDPSKWVRRPDPYTHETHNTHNSHETHNSEKTKGSSDSCESGDLGESGVSGANSGSNWWTRNLPQIQEILKWPSNNSIRTSSSCAEETETGGAK